MDEEHTTIRISEDTKERLQTYGEMGMTYDEVLQQLLDEMEEDD